MQIMTVTAFVAYVNDTFKAIWDTQEVAIEGEVSGFRISQGQWVSFDLKDPAALINIFLPLGKLHVPVQDGMRVRVFGLPRVYPKYGKFSVSAEQIELVGEGALQKALAMLRQKLDAEGLFDPARKRMLPRFPERIALIASRESAAYGDFIRILKERWGGLQIDVYHVLVQGERAPQDIMRAMALANEIGSPPYEGGVRGGSSYDAIVITRGGGSLDELMAFNHEGVVRAIYGSKIPTLVGIGHERDITLAEEVADVRGSTPTDCARRLVPDRQDVLYELLQMEEKIFDTLHATLDEQRRTVDDAIESAHRWIERIRTNGEHLIGVIESGFDSWYAALVAKVDSYSRLARSFDPRSVVRRGYAIVRDANGKIISTVKRIAVGQVIAAEVRDGVIDAKIIK